MNDMRKWVTTESVLQRKWHNEILVFNSVFAIIVLLLIETDKVNQGITEWNYN